MAGVLTNIMDARCAMPFDVAEEYPGRDQPGQFGVDFGIIAFDETDGFGFHDATQGLTHHQLKTAFSDHRPLWLRFQTNAGESDATAD